MPTERTVRRYTAYFRGWATAFGTHDKELDEKHGFTWLFGDDQVGLILTPGIKRFLYPRLLGKSASAIPRVSLRTGSLGIQDEDIRFDADQQPGFETLFALLRQDGDLHLFQTYHLVYPGGTRILTLSRRAPLPLVYHEIPHLMVSLV